MKFLQRRRERPTADVQPHEPATPREPVGFPVARYDKLSVAEVQKHLSELSPNELSNLSHHERGHQNRVAVLADIDALLGNQPWPGYDALDASGVRFGLEGAPRERFVMVLAYERAHRNRADVVLAAQQRG